MTIYVFACLTILVVITYYIIYWTNTIESFNTIDYNSLRDALCTTPFQERQLSALLTFDSNVYPIRSKLSKPELDFIYQYIHTCSESDVTSDKHISSYTYGISLLDNGIENRSRFAFGTKTNFDKMRENMQDLASHIGISTLPVDNTHLWNGVGWDVVNKELKFYLLSKDKLTMVCYVYTVERDSNNNIIHTEFKDTKLYSVDKTVTLMRKGDITVKQYNDISRITKQMYTTYPKLKRTIGRMKRYGYNLDTFSEYNNQINLYFD